MLCGLESASIVFDCALPDQPVTIVVATVSDHSFFAMV